jgi:hypothetical protein
MQAFVLITVFRVLRQTVGEIDPRSFGWCRSEGKNTLKKHKRKNHGNDEQFEYGTLLLLLF